MRHLLLNLEDDFHLLDFCASHKQLLLRLMKKKGRKHNIDIIFKGVHIMLLSSNILGLKIKELSHLEINNSLSKEVGFSTKNELHIYLLENKYGEHFYINCLGFKVYKNELDLLESSIGRYDFKNYGELIGSHS